MSETEWIGSATELRADNSWGFSVGLTTQAIALLPREHNRMAFVINNESGVLYVLLSVDPTVLASENNYTYRLTPHCMLENTFWKGPVSVKHTTGGATIYVTDFIGGY